VERFNQLKREEKKQTERKKEKKRKEKKSLIDTQGYLQWKCKTSDF
jgi:hypothetical protein